MKESGGPQAGESCHRYLGGGGVREGSKQKAPPPHTHPEPAATERFSERDPGS